MSSYLDLTSFLIIVAERWPDFVLCCCKPELIFVDLELLFVDLELLLVDLELLFVDLELLFVDLELIFVDLELIFVDLDLTVWCINSSFAHFDTSLLLIMSLVLNELKQIKRIEWRTKYIKTTVFGSSDDFYVIILDLIWFEGLYLNFFVMRTLDCFALLQCNKLIDNSRTQGLMK